MTNDRESIFSLNNVDSNLKFLAIVVVLVEIIFGVILVNTEKSDPFKVWYLIIMVVFFLVFIIFTLASQSRKDKPVSKHLPQKNEQDGLDKNYNIIQIPHTSRTLTIKLAENVAIVSESLRQETEEKIINLIKRKIKVHTTIFEFPNPSALIAVDDVYFGRFSWDDKSVICDEIFELPPDLDRERWGQWISLNQVYVEAFSAGFRQPGRKATEEELQKTTEMLAKLYARANDWIGSHNEVATHSVLISLRNLKSHLLAVDFDKKGLRENKLQIEFVLNATHELIKKLMPRVISV